MEFYESNLHIWIANNIESNEYKSMDNVKKALKFIFELIEGLIEIHEADIVHGDIKPLNILLHNNDRIVYGDFGVNQTGTNDYICQEQLNTGVSSKKGDAFSLGVTIYEILYGIHQVAYF